MKDLGLPEPAIHFTLPPLNAEFSHSNHSKAMALLKEYDNVFSSGPHKIGLLNGDLTSS